MPVANTLFSMWMSKTHREASPWFYAGLILVIVGAVVVLVFNPAGGAAREIAFPQLVKVLAFVLLTAICWGAYGPLLHKGQMQMGNSRLRPFLCVGAAYFVVAVVVPLILRTTLGEQGDLSFWGAFWSLAGGIAGALGSLGVILAFTYGGKPIYVMPLVFGGAPVVNTFISIATAKQLSSISPFFYAGLIVVIAGAVSVLVFAPRGAPHAAPAQPCRLRVLRLDTTDECAAIDDSRAAHVAIPLDVFALAEMQIVLAAIGLQPRGFLVEHV